MEEGLMPTQRASLVYSAFPLLNNDWIKKFLDWIDKERRCSKLFFKDLAEE